ncbi:MAG: murein biosynthesis integral membrane protein MurJ [Actinomycetes bacterium]
MSSLEPSILRSSAVMAIGTIFSRITGLVRNLLLVAVLGTTLLGDTYNVANTMPNILYNLLLGGALTAVFVPQLVRATREKDGGSAFISKLLTATTLLLGALVILSVLIAPVLVRIFATGYVGRPEFHLTVLFMRYCLPQIFFMGIFALLGQIANAKGHFGPMMWAPVLNNVLTISIFGWFLHSAHHLSVTSISFTQTTWLGLGTTAGYVIQTLALIPVIRKTKIQLRFRLDWRDPELRKSWHLATWTLLFAAISQVSYLVTVNLSTGAAVRALKAGVATGVGFTPYSNAFLILMLPHSIFTISIVTALLPQLSSLVIEKRISEIHDRLVKTIRLVGIITVPSAVAFLLFGPLITSTLFFGISKSDSQYLGYTLAGFSFGLLPLSINLIALRGLNAFENVKLQVVSNALMNIVGVLASVAVAIFLPPKWVTVGLAGSLSFSYFFGAWITIRLLRRYQISIGLREIVGLYLKLIALALVIAIPLRLALSSLPGGNTIHLLFVLGVSAIGYILLAHLFKIQEVARTLQLLRRGREEK